MRDLINILTEDSLSKATLIKYGATRVETLINMINDGENFQVDPGKTEIYGDTVQIDPSMVDQLQAAINSGDLDKNFPAKVLLLIDGQPTLSPWSVLFKSAAFGGRGGERQPYNAGHLAELMMGLAVTMRFVNRGGPTSIQQIIDLAGQINSGVVPGSQTMQFSLEQTIDYPQVNSKNDQLSFVAKVPYSSAEQFVKQYQTGQFDSILQNVFASAVKYANESEGVDNACERVKKDKNSNKIDVVSDGVKGTKADLTLKIDDTNVRLLSLKTFSTDTLGQISGVTIDALNRWFKSSFGLDLSQYNALFDPQLGNEKIFDNVLRLYTDVIFPVVKKEVDKQTPGQEARLVRQLASAAQYHARGEDNEDVEVVKLDDKVKEGNYKVLRFSDDLYEAMKHLDLDAELVAKGQKGRTIKIIVKPAPGEHLPKGSNRLCQFRTQKMGNAYRNYYEIGPMMEKLTELPARAGIDTGDEKTARLIGPAAKAARNVKEPDFSPDVLGRTRRQRQR